MADRPEREIRRGGRKGRKKVCSFCVDRAEFIDYKDVAKLRRFISRCCPTLLTDFFSKARGFPPGGKSLFFFAAPVGRVPLPCPVAARFERSPYEVF